MKWKKTKGSVANESWMGKSFVDDDKEPNEDVRVQPQREGDVFYLPYLRDWGEGGKV